MVACEWCHKEMLDRNVTTCEVNVSVEFPDGVALPAAPYNNQYFTTPQDEVNHRCHDCGIALGGFHHPGCDMERCPRCGGQLISCGCLDEDDDE